MCTKVRCIRQSCIRIPMQQHQIPIMRTKCRTIVASLLLTTYQVKSAMGFFFLDWGGREEGVRTAASEARKLNQSPAASFSTRHHKKIALLVNQNISSIFMAQNIPLSFQISLIMKSLRGAILFEKKGSPLMSKEEENERPLALEPCPPLKSYLLRPSGSTRMFEPQVSHMSKNFNSSFAKQARKWA